LSFRKIRGTLREGKGEKGKTSLSGEKKKPALTKTIRFYGLRGRKQLVCQKEKSVSHHQRRKKG